MFLAKIKLPGEAPRIDRIIEAFAKEFCKQNEGEFTSSGLWKIILLQIL